MVSPAVSLAVLRPNYRTQFINRLKPILGDTRLLWLPGGAEGLAVVEDSGNGLVITHGAAPGARLVSLGRGHGLTFNGTTQFATSPDAENLSFGNGATDSAVSFLAFASVTNTAAARTIVAKLEAVGSGNGSEWTLNVDSSDNLSLLISDDSAGAITSRTSDVGNILAQGAWGLLAATYSGLGGATAGDGITLYRNGLLIASTVSNNAGYTAMENKAAELSVGANVVHTLNFYNGSLALLAICQKALTASEHYALWLACRGHFGV